MYTTQLKRERGRGLANVSRRGSFAGATRAEVPVVYGICVGVGGQVIERKRLPGRDCCWPTNECIGYRLDDNLTGEVSASVSPSK